MAIELFPYQITGRDWLASQTHALLADAQRLGKSVQSISAARELRIERILVVCRAVGRAEWKHSFEQVAPRHWRVSIIDLEVAPHMPPPQSATIVNYEGVHKILALDGASFGLVIVDESHYLKNLETKRAQEILGKNGLIQRAPRMWCLTGTPTPNGFASELWPVLYTFGATKFRYTEFVKRYCITRETGFGEKIIGNNPAHLEEFKTVMREKILRRMPEDVGIQMPRVTFTTHTVKPGRVHLALARSFAKWVIPVDRTNELEKILEQEMGVFEGIFKGKDGPEFTEEAFSAMCAAAPSISTLCKYNALQKIEPICDIISAELDSGAYQKCVIFGMHRDAIEGLRMQLAKYKPVVVYGGTNPTKVDKYIRAFQNPKSRCRVFIGNIQAAGTSICLDVASFIHFIEESWVPGDNAQAAARCGGPRQTETIHIRNYSLDNSADQRKASIIAIKSRAILKLHETGHKVGTKEEIEGLF